MAHSRLIIVDNDSLGGQKQENKTDNFGRFSLGRADLNWIITAKVVGIILRFSSS